MAISQELQQKLDYYEQVYNGLDEPVPFKGGLKIYPVMVKDYYNFYNCLGCITMDKTIKVVPDEYGRPKKVSNPKGIGQSYLEYLIEQMQDSSQGAIITTQVMSLFELVFHIKKGLYCPHCGKEVTYEEALKGLDEFINKSKSEAQTLYEEAILSQEEDTGEKIEDHTLPKEIMDKVIQKARIDFLNQMQKCPDCEQEMRDVFSVKDNNGYKTLMIKDVELNSTDIDELKAIVPRQNILDYDGDKYIDPELKEELELKAKMQNKDYTSPTLEKQLVCVGVTTGYTLEYLKTISMRKLSMMLRLVDRKETYYAQLQASMSGMVTFKEDPKHWIFSDDKKNIKDELTNIEDFEKKFEQVT